MKSRSQNVTPGIFAMQWMNREGTTGVSQFKKAVNSRCRAVVGEGRKSSGKFQILFTGNASMRPVCVSEITDTAQTKILAFNVIRTIGRRAFTSYKYIGWEQGACATV